MKMSNRLVSARQAPLFTLDLQKCSKNGEVAIANREECPKARSFKLEYTGETENASEFFIAVEAQTDLEMWLKKINAILNTIQNWKI